MICKIKNNYEHIAQKLIDIRMDRLALMGTGKIKNFDKNLISYIYCDGKRHVRTNGVDTDTVICRCPDFENIVFSKRIKEDRKAYTKMTFDTFKGFKKEVKIIENFYQNFNTDILILTGNRGTGKTHLLKSLQFQALKNNINSKFMLAQDLLRLFSDAKMRDNRPEKYEARNELQNLYYSDLILIDDIGAGDTATSKIFKDEILVLLEKKKNKIAMSTNFDLVENEFFKDINFNQKTQFLNNYFNERIISRFFHNSEIIKFTGKDWRLK